MTATDISADDVGPPELVDFLLSGQSFTARAVDRFRTTFQREGLHHDYKSGSVAAGKGPGVAEGRRRLLDCVLSLANSEGGVLFVGVGNDGERTVDGYPANVNENEWLHGLLINYWAAFSRPPRTYSVPYDDARRVVLVVVPRSDGLILQRDGRLVLRTTDGIFSAPDYLARALVLGTRSQPTFEITPIVLERKSGELNPPRGRGGAIIRTRRIELIVAARNTSLLWADEVMLCATWWRLHEIGDFRKPPAAFASAVEAPQPPLVAGGGTIDPASWQLMFCAATQPTLHPLAADDALSIRFDLIVPEAAKLTLSSAVALAVIARNAQPQFFTLEVSARTSQAGGSQAEPFETLVERTSSPRAAVQW